MVKEEKKNHQMKIQNTKTYFYLYNEECERKNGMFTTMNKTLGIPKNSQDRLVT